MSDTRIGGGESRTAYFTLFLLGVVLGSAVRIGAFVVPARGVHWLETTLLPGRTGDPND